GKGPQEEQENILKLVEGQVQKIKALITDILEYSRSGYEKVEKQKVDLSLIMSEIVGGLEKPDNFLIDIEDNLPVLITEKVFISQVFNNLISNSIKYNDKQEGKVKTGYNTVEAENVFYVEDNGPGIPPSERENIFKIFTVIKETRKNDSTGVGLAIIKKILNVRGGEIWVKDAEYFNTGSRFCFTWPAEVVID